MIPLSLLCGCGAKERSKDTTVRVTWHQDVAPLVNESCVGCHVDGGIAPFSLTTYEAAAPFAGMMADATELGVMPPFLAQDTEECQVNHPWVDDLRLTAEEQLMLRRWADQGAPEGDPETAAALPALRRRVLGEPFCALARLHLLDLRQAQPGCHLAKFWNHM